MPWRAALEQARSPAEVLGVARRFVAAIPVGDWTNVPADCRPRTLRDCSDIDLWNVKLAEASRAIWGTGADGRTLYALANFFLRASMRLSHLREESLAG